MEEFVLSHGIVLDCVLPFIWSSHFNRGTVKKGELFGHGLSCIQWNCPTTETEHCLPHSP